MTSWIYTSYPTSTQNNLKQPKTTSLATTPKQQKTLFQHNQDIFTHLLLIEYLSIVDSKTTDIFDMYITPYFHSQQPQTTHNVKPPGNKQSRTTKTTLLPEPRQFHTLTTD